MLPTQPSTVEDLAKAMRTMPQVELQTEHYFAGGMYCRALNLPAGTLAAGKQHKQPHFFIVVQGAIAIIQDGAERKVYEAPSIIVSGEGTRRAALALVDSVCITVHRTDKTDLDEIEEELIVADPTALFDSRNQLKGLLT